MLRSQTRLAFFLVLLLGTLFGGQTGKIAGRVTDAETGDPLIGVNIMIPERGLGASTDIEGYYVILNVSPGTYRVETGMIGYTPMISQNVRVVMDQTTTVDFDLTSEVLGMEAVTVVSTRPVVVRDVSASQLNVDSETIQQLPVADVDEVVGLQAGVEGLEIRGGDSRQTAFIMDGFLMNDTRSNVPVSSISLSAVKEIQVQSGGFNAEYGNLRSGVINVVTAEGANDRYGGSFTYRISPAAAKHFDLSPYDPDSYYLRSRMDDAVAWDGTNGGGWDDYTQSQYPFFEGWNAVSQATLQDDDPSNDLSPTAAQLKWLYQHRRGGEIVKPDYTIDAGFGGPVPVVNNLLGNARFHLSHRSEQNMFVVPLSRDAYTSSTTRLKVSGDVSENIKLTATLQSTIEKSVIPYSWKTTPTGSYLQGTYAVANLVSGGEDVLFMPGYYSPLTINRMNLGLKLNHMLSPVTFYEVIFQQMRHQYDAYEMDARDTTLIELTDGLWVDEAPYGYNGDEWMNLGRDSSLINTTILRGDLTHQVNKFHQVKTGIQLIYNDYQIKSFMESNKDTWSRELIYNVNPFLFSMYAQDKLEFEGFVANAGLRAEFSNANTVRYLLLPYDDNLTTGVGADLEDNATSADVKGEWTLSPRLGISHPITIRSKLYFNYGHFYTEPASSYRFRLQREYSGQVTHIGNPDMKLERTIAYELGYDHALADAYLIKLATYYKDVSNQAGWISYTSVDRSVDYAVADNNNYADIRGIELTMRKHSGNWFTGFVNYTYQVESQGYFGLLHYYQDPKEQREYIEDYPPDQEKPRPRPYFRANLVFRTPERWGPGLMGQHLLGDWQLSVLGTWKAGAYATWNPHDIPGLRYNVQWVDTYNIDLRLNKALDLGSRKLELFIDVDNALNTRFLSYSGFSGTRDWQSYMQSLNFDFEDGVEHGDDRVGDYRPLDVAYDPLEPNPDDDPDIKARNDERKETRSYIDNPDIRSLTFLDPRQITLGLRFNF